MTIIELNRHRKTAIVVATPKSLISTKSDDINTPKPPSVVSAVVTIACPVVEMAVTIASLGGLPAVFLSS